MKSLIYGAFILLLCGMMTSPVQASMGRMNADAAKNSLFNAAPPTPPSQTTAVWQQYTRQDQALPVLEVADIPFMQTPMPIEREAIDVSIVMQERYVNDTVSDIVLAGEWAPVRKSQYDVADNKKSSTMEASISSMLGSGANYLSGALKGLTIQEKGQKLDSGVQLVNYQAL